MLSSHSRSDCTIVLTTKYTASNRPPFSIKFACVQTYQSSALPNEHLVPLLSVYLEIAVEDLRASLSAVEDYGDGFKSLGNLWDVYIRPSVGA